MGFHSDAAPGASHHISLSVSRLCPNRGPKSARNAAASGAVTAAETEGAKLPGLYPGEVQQSRFGTTSQCQAKRGERHRILEACGCRCQYPGQG